MVPDIRKSSALFGDSHACLLITVVLRCRWVWSIGGMVRGVNQSIWRKPCPSAALSTANLNRTGPGSNAGLKAEINPHYIYRSSPYVPHRALTSLLRCIILLSSYVFRRLMLAHLQWPESSHWFTHLWQFTFLLYRNCCDYISFVLGIYTCSSRYVYALHIYNTTTVWTTQEERNVPHTCEQTTA